jgi:hypothetical protein
MDDEDAQYYNKQIKHFEQNSDGMTHLLQQLYVVKSSLGAINESLSDMEYNEAKVQNGLVQLRQYLDLVVSETGQTVNALLIKVTVESHIARFNDAVISVQRTLDLLIESIVNAQKGILQPQVVSPNLLVEALIRSSPSFPRDTAAPIPLSIDSAYLLY